MNLIQKESDLSKSEMLYSFKQIRLKRFGHFLAKKTNLYPTYYTFLYDMQKRHIKCLFCMTIVPVLLFLKGPRVTMASSALQGFIRCQPNVPRLYCIYIIPHKPKHNFKLFSFNNIINPILDYQLRLNQIVYLYTQVLLTPNTIHTITFLLNIL